MRQTRQDRAVRGAVGRLRGPWRGSAIAAALALIAGTGLGCATTPAPEPPTQYPEYEVGAPDRLTVMILPEPAVLEDVVVRPDGKITVQLVGDVVAGGPAPTEIADDIERRISKFKRGAVVTVKLASAQSSSITVIGEVRRPGAFPLDKQIRVAEALGLVGGPTSLANDDSVRVVRPGNPTEVLRVDMDAIRGGDLTTNVQLYGGDIIYVPPTVWARVGYVIQAILFPFEPLLGVAKAAGGAALVQ